MRYHRVVPLVMLIVVAGTAHAAPVQDADATEDLEATLPKIGDRMVATLTQGATAAGDGAHTATTGLASMAAWVAHGANAVVDAAANALRVTADASQASLTAAATSVGTLTAATGSLLTHAATSTLQGVTLAATSTTSLAVSGLVALHGAITTVAKAAATAVAAVVSTVAGLVAGLGHSLLTASPEAKRTLAAGAAGAGGTALAWSAWRELLRQGILSPLYSRLGRDELLEHDVRRAIFDHVRENPGVHVSALADAVDVGWGTAVYHLERLESARLLTTERRGNHKCIFENGGAVTEEAREAIPLLKSERAREVLAYLTDNPAASQKELGETLDMSPALVSWHVGRLADAGLVTKERRGRGNVLHVEEETAAPALAATA